MFYRKSQFSICTEKTYNLMIKHFNIDKIDGFIPYEELIKYKTKEVYNPQKTPGKPYKAKRKGKLDIYNCNLKDLINESGDRYPRSVIKFGRDKKKYHPTQKPVGLCELLIKTYSNEGDNVLDFTMGSGSCGVACINTNRNFTGIEKDYDIFKTAYYRMLCTEIINRSLN